MSSPNLPQPLYNVPRGTWVMPIDNAQAPPGARPIHAGEAVFFRKLDGMYSYCIDIHGQVVHLPAYQTVVIAEPE